MVIFHTFVKLPEGTMIDAMCWKCHFDVMYTSICTYLHYMASGSSSRRIVMCASTPRWNWRRLFCRRDVATVFFLGAERASLIILLNWVLIFQCFNAHWLAAQILPKYCSCLKRQRVWSVVSIWMKFFFPKQTQQTISKMGTKKYGFQHVPNHPPVWLWFSALYSHYIAIT